MTKKKTVTIEVDVKTMKALKAASKAISELASSAIVAVENLAKPRR